MKTLFLTLFLSVSLSAGAAPVGKSLKERGLMLTPAGEFLLSIGFINKEGKHTRMALISHALGGLVGLGYFSCATLPLERLGRAHVELPPFPLISSACEGASRAPSPVERFLTPSLDQRYFGQGWKIAGRIPGGGALKAQYLFRSAISGIATFTILILPYLYESFAVKKKLPVDDEDQSRAVIPEIYHDLIRQFNIKMYALLEDPNNLLIQRDVALAQILEVRAAILAAGEEGESDGSQELEALTAHYDEIDRAITDLSNEDQLAMNESYQEIEDRLEHEGLSNDIDQQLLALEQINEGRMP